MLNKVDYVQLFLCDVIKYFKSYREQKNSYKFTPRKAFWSLYKENKELFKKQGIYVFKGKKGYEYDVVIMKPEKQADNKMRVIVLPEDNPYSDPSISLDNYDNSDEDVPFWRVIQNKVIIDHNLIYASIRGNMGKWIFYVLCV